MSTSANMYRVGDYVYFESSHSAPYQIRRIEELAKTANGAEAKVICFYRRQDIPSTLISLADKHQIALEEEQEREINETLTDKQRHQLKQRELFFSRQMETIPATHFRGKCTVTLLNETESLASYLDKEDTFFYTLVYEPNQKTLLADRGEIRVGSRYQADKIPIKPSTTWPSNLEDGLIEDGRDLNTLETLVYHPSHSLMDQQIEQYITIAKSIGTFARSLDPMSSLKQSSLHLTAATACRDITVQHAMDVLHEHEYDIGKALLSLCPVQGPIVCRDELEEWSPAEAQLFEESLDKFGKNFFEIRQEVLPWKTMRNLIEYYYMWKTTDRYVQQKRIKALESESKLKQVYTPSYNSGKPQPLSNGALNAAAAAAGAIHGGDVAGKACESCGVTSSPHWYAWGTAHMGNRLCNNCWNHYKKFGGLKYPSRADAEKAISMKLNNGSYSLTNSPISVNNNGNGNTTTTAIGAAAVVSAVASSAATTTTTTAGSSVVVAAAVVGNAASSASAAASSSSSSSSSTSSPSSLNLSTSINETAAQYPCRECNKVFNRQERLITHMASHRTNAYKCGPCGKEFRQKAQLIRHGQQAHGLSGRTSPRPVMKTRTAFYLAPNLTNRAARLLCGQLIRCRRMARKPFDPVNTTQIKLDCTAKLVDGQLPSTFRHRLRPCSRGKVNTVAHRLGVPEMKCPEWLKIPPKTETKQPKRLNFEMKNGHGPSKDDHCSESVKENENHLNTGNGIQSKKRIFEHQNGNDVEPLSVPLKRRSLAPPIMTKQPTPELLALGGRSEMNNGNGKARIAIARVGGKSKLISWVDAPDDLFFFVSGNCRKIRKQVQAGLLRRFARRPGMKLEPTPVTSKDSSSSSSSS